MPCQHGQYHHQFVVLHDMPGTVIVRNSKTVVEINSNTQTHKHKCVHRHTTFTHKCVQRHRHTDMHTHTHKFVQRHCHTDMHTQTHKHAQSHTPRAHTGSDVRKHLGNCVRGYSSDGENGVFPCVFFCDCLTVSRLAIIVCCHGVTA